MTGTGGVRGPWDFRRRSRPPDRVLACGPVDASDDEIRRALLADILANPDDDAPRLVFADWLTERGDPRGELISLQCAAQHATGGVLARHVNRASALLERHGEAWVGEIRQIVRGVELKRGFVASINATGSVFAKCGALFEQEPIEELRVIKPSARDLATIAKAPHLAKLRALVMLDPARIETEAHVQALGALLCSPRLSTLRVLELRLAVAGAAGPSVRDTLAGLSLPALEQLKLRVRAIDEAARPPVIVSAIAAAKLPKLRQLAVRKDSLGTLRSALPGIAITALVD